MSRDSATRMGLLCVFALLSRPVLGLDLLETCRRAQDHDARLAAARAAYEAGKEKLSQGRAQLMPTVNLRGAKTQYDASIDYQGPTTFQGGSRRYTNEEVEVSLTQPLYRKQNYALYRQGEAQADLAEAQYTHARQELILRVAQVYFDLLAAQDNLSLATAQKYALLAQYHQAKARLDAGVAAITEVHESKARADIATAQEIAALNDVDVKRRSFWKVAGLEPAALSGVAPNIPLVAPDPADIGKWNEAAQQQNPQLRALRETVRVAEQELEIARGGHFPTVDLVAGYTKGEASGSVYTSASSETSWRSAGVQLQVPLYQGGYVNSRVRETAANRDKAREEMEDAKREVTVQVQQAYSTVAHGVPQVQALEQAVASSESALEATRAGLRVGTRNLVDVLNATQQLYTARRDHARARYDYLLNRLKLEAAAGQLDEDDLASINTLLRGNMPELPSP
jgi:outer membrane protein